METIKQLDAFHGVSEELAKLNGDMSVLTTKLSLAETQAQTHLQGQQELAQRLLKAEQLLSEKNEAIGALEASLQKQVDLASKLETRMRMEGEKHANVLNEKAKEFAEQIKRMKDLENQLEVERRMQRVHPNHWQKSWLSARTVSPQPLQSWMTRRCCVKS